MDRHLNIVSFDVPYPANYGGVIDVYHKIRMLHAAGVKVHLHCFTASRESSVELEKLCEETFYYKRKTGLLANFSLLPYTVKSRLSPLLRKRLLANNYPVLFEVLHTCYLMKDAAFRGKILAYRHSNIEHDYYAGLARAERALWRKLFHFVESARLRRFEKVLRHASLIFAVNEKDAGYFKGKYPLSRTVYLPSFHDNDTVSVRSSKGDFVLIHGNLSVAENYLATIWLLKNVVGPAGIKTVIAGLDPPAALVKAVALHRHVSLIVSPEKKFMRDLISNAQVHLLYTAQPTGLKLKLLNVLFAGRFVLCNPHMLAGTGLTENISLRVAADAHGFTELLKALMHLEFNDEMISERKSAVARFSNDTNCTLLMHELFGAAKA